METAGNKLKIYCETSFWSYLVGGPTSDEKVARWQALTRKWWEEIAPKCEIFVSQHVFDEAQQGNRMMASARMRLILEVRQLDGKTLEIETLAGILQTGHAVPQNEKTDASHIATAAVRGMDVLLTWNCKHMANPITLPKTAMIIGKAGYSCPVIVTPEEFLARREEFGL